MLVKSIKKMTVAFTGLLLLASVFTHAQNTQAITEALAKRMTDSLAYLQLTAKQTTDAQALNTTAATALVQTAAKAKADTSFKGKPLIQQVMGIMKTRNSGLKSMLTPDQQKLYGQHQIEQMADLQTKIMAAQLNLTDEQMPQVYQVNLQSTGEMMEDMAKLKGSKGKLGKMKAAKGVKSDSKDKDKAMKKILNEDQYKKYEANKEAMQAAMKEKMNEKKG